jgi:serine O-acetyltransferase
MTRERPISDRDLGLFDRNPEGVSFWQLIKEDYLTHESEFFSQGFWAVAVHRFGNWRMGIRSRLLRLPLSLLYKVLVKCVEWFCGISLSYTVLLGRRVRIWHQGGMVLGALSIGSDVHIRQNVTFGVRRRGDPRWLKPTIEDRCDIGAGAVIVGGITIGHDSMIGANVVVATDVPPHSLVTAQAPTVRPLRSTESIADAHD